MSGGGKFPIHSTFPETYQQYDLCLVFPIDPETDSLPSETLLLIRRLVKVLGKKYIYVYYSSADNLTINCLIRAGLKFLKQKASNESKWKFLLDSEILKVLASTGTSNSLNVPSTSDIIEPFSIPHVPFLSKYRPYDYIYMSYFNDEKIDPLYVHQKNLRHPFNKTLRIKMLLDFLENQIYLDDPFNLSAKNSLVHTNTSISNSNGGLKNNLSLSLLLRRGIIKEYYSIHEDNLKEDLINDTFRIIPSFNPNDSFYNQIKNINLYFGERISFFLLFLNHFHFWMILPAIAGIVIQVLAIVYKSFTRPELCFFSFFLCFCLIFMLNYWKKVERIYAMKWNQGSIEENSTAKLYDFNNNRPEFYGVTMKSYINGEEILYFSSFNRALLYFFSYFIIFVYVGMTFVSLFCFIYFVKIQLFRNAHNEIPFHQLQWLLSFLIITNSTVFNYFFKYINNFTTNLENHRLESTYNNVKIIKNLIFSFLNISITLYYYAFMARYINIDESITPDNYINECNDGDSCMYPIGIHLLVIVGGDMFYYFLTKYIRKYFYYYFLSHVKYFLSFLMIEFSFFIPKQTLELCSDIWFEISGQRKKKSKEFLRQQAEMYANNAYNHYNNSNNSNSFDEYNQQEYNPQDQEYNHDENNYYHASGSFQPNTTRDPDQVPERSPGGHRNDEESSLGFSQSHVNIISRKVSRNFSRFNSLGNRKFTAPRGGNVVDTNDDFTVSPDQDEEEVEENNDFNYTSPYANSYNGPSSPYDRSNMLGARQSSPVVNYKYDDNNSDEKVEKFSFHSKETLPYDTNEEISDSLSIILRLLTVIFSFGTAMPGVFFIFFVFITLEYYGQFWKLLILSHRVVPENFFSFTTYLIVFDIIVVIAVITNSCLIIFTMSTFNDWALKYRLLLLIAFNAFFYILHGYFYALYAYEPQDITIQKLRTDHIVKKFIPSHLLNKDNLNSNNENGLSLEML